MELMFAATGTGGHTEATFENEEIRISFHKTSPEERGMIETLVERGKKAGMVLHTVDKEGGLKPLENESLLQEIFKGKGQVALKGTAEAVKKLALDLVEKEIQDGKLVMHAQSDGTWKILRQKEDFKPKEDEKQVVTSHEKQRGG